MTVPTLKPERSTSRVIERTIPVYDEIEDALGNGEETVE